MVMFYLLQEWPRILDALQRIVPRPWLPRTMRILNDIDSVMSEFLRGQLSVMMLLAVFYSIGLLFAGLNFALPVGVLTALIGVIVALLWFAKSRQRHALQVLDWYSDFVGIVAEREEQAIRAQRRLTRNAKWREQETLPEFNPRYLLKSASKSC